jgi:hypothetical protein
MFFRKKEVLDLNSIRKEIVGQESSLPESKIGRLRGNPRILGKVFELSAQTLDLAGKVSFGSMKLLGNVINYTESGYQEYQKRLENIKVKNYVDKILLKFGLKIKENGLEAYQAYLKIISSRYQKEALEQNLPQFSLEILREIYKAPQIYGVSRIAVLQLRQCLNTLIVDNKEDLSENQYNLTTEDILGAASESGLNQSQILEAYSVIFERISLNIEIESDYEQEGQILKNNLVATLANWAGRVVPKVKNLFEPRETEYSYEEPDVNFEQYNPTSQINVPPSSQSKLTNNQPTAIYFEKGYLEIANLEKNFDEFVTDSAQNLIQKVTLLGQQENDYRKTRLGQYFAFLSSQDSEIQAKINDFLAKNNLDRNNNLTPQQLAIKILNKAILEGLQVKFVRPNLNNIPEEIPIKEVFYENEELVRLVLLDDSEVAIDKNLVSGDINDLSLLVKNQKETNSLIESQNYFVNGVTQELLNSASSLNFNLNQFFNHYFENKNFNGDKILELKVKILNQFIRTSNLKIGMNLTNVRQVGPGITDVNNTKSIQQISGIRLTKNNIILYFDGYETKELLKQSSEYIFSQLIFLPNQSSQASGLIDPDFGQVQNREGENISNEELEQSLEKLQIFALETIKGSQTTYRNYAQDILADKSKTREFFGWVPNETSCRNMEEDQKLNFRSFFSWIAGQNNSKAYDFDEDEIPDFLRQISEYQLQEFINITKIAFENLVEEDEAESLELSSSEVAELFPPFFGDLVDPNEFQQFNEPQTDPKV